MKNQYLTNLLIYVNKMGKKRNHTHTRLENINLEQKLRKTKKIYFYKMKSKISGILVSTAEQEMNVSNRKSTFFLSLNLI